MNRRVVVILVVLVVGAGYLTAQNSRRAKSKQSKEAKPKQRIIMPKNTGNTSLEEARRGFVSSILRHESSNTDVPKPPPEIFQLVQYEAPVGKLAAYLSPRPKDGKKHPAIVWITGGDYSSIGDVWSDPNDGQSASAYRKAGIVMMFPSLRGGNKNPGVHEGFWGEVDDVVAAGEYLAQLEYVDPERIYLGGHSTGGTLVLLVAEFSQKFRAVFAFGPVCDIRAYPEEYTPFDTANDDEIRLRSPMYWQKSIHSPTFLIEGKKQGNYLLYIPMQLLAKNPRVHFLGVEEADHFDVLGPSNRLLAERILRDTGATCNIQVTEKELDAAFAAAH